MRHCICKTYPLDYDPKKTLEIRISEAECDNIHCPNNQKHLQVDDLDWSLYATPLSTTIKSGSRSKYFNQSVSKFIVKALSQSSISGVNRLFSSKTRLQRFIWALVLIVCLSGFWYQTYHFSILYRRKPSVVQIAVENDGLAEFPAVSLCNTNRLRRSELCKYKAEYCDGNFNNLTISEPEIGEIIFEILTQKNSAQKKLLGHSTDMIQSCIFNGRPKVGEEECMKMLEYFYDPDYGNCYTIPPRNSKGEILEAREADFWQEANDLSLLIDVESDELLEKKRRPGIIVTVHDDSSAPDIHTDGHLLGPGRSYTFTIQKLCTVGCSQYYQQKKCKFITKNLSLFFEELPFDPKQVSEKDKECAATEELRTQDYCRSICGLPCRDTIFVVTVGSTSLTEQEITMELFSYLGGYSGVWLGFSLLTVYELIEILACTAQFAFQKHQRVLQHKKETTPEASTKGCKQLITTQYGTFYTPNYPDKYPRYSRCQYIVEKYSPDACEVKLTVHAFEVTRMTFTNCSEDFLEIQDGDKRYRICGDLPPGTKKRMHHHQCDQMFQSPSFVITSPGYPNYFGPNFRCTYTIFRPDASVCSLELDFEEFNLGKHNPASCDHGAYLELSGKNRLCHDIEGKMIVHASEFQDPIIFEFVSDSLTSGKGFRIEVKHIPNTCPGFGSHLPKTLPRCYQEVSFYSGYFSPSPMVASCELLVRRADPSVCMVRLQVTARNFLSVPCSYNYIELPDGIRMCISVTERRLAEFEEGYNFMILNYVNWHNPEFNLLVEQMPNSCRMQRSDLYTSMNRKWSWKVMPR
ncbi:CUB domain-containing protein [Trichonephila inaurata madagascariensis]|uniref:CUB domain-containing protein n=1 Tax=Trichonephila inaurata madagascariensis TaxID=2747483 RepID=A0A8X7BV33_9ARAC|nr:CUB domain-containing protein [Trichonephila inaurata madagascariensis]